VRRRVVIRYALISGAFIAYRTFYMHEFAYSCKNVPA
jgi:hypothetical protein